MLKLEFTNLYPWKRSRTSHGRHYDCQTEDKRQLAYYTLLQCKKQNFDIKKKLDGPLGIILIFYKKYPNKFPKAQKSLLNPCHVKPDIDNLEKFMFDMLQFQAGLIKDDSNICAKLSFKLWGPNNATIIFLDRWNDTSRFIHDYDIVGFNGHSFDMYDRILSKLE